MRAASYPSGTGRGHTRQWLGGCVGALGRQLGRCCMFVAPLRFGGGTKRKVIGAMAVGVAVVTTRIGAEGLGIVDGEHAGVAHDAGGFAAAVLRMLEKPELGTGFARGRWWSDRCPGSASGGT